MGYKKGKIHPVAYNESTQRDVELQLCLFFNLSPRWVVGGDTESASACFYENIHINVTIH
jgi:hypothetical protein